MTDRFKYTSQLKIKKEMKEGTEMKKMKKMMALVIAVVMMMAMSMTTMAASEGKITITNAVVGEKYTLYKVFDATTIENREKDESGIAYTSTWMTTSNDYFNVDTQGNITIKAAGKNDEEKLSNEAIAWLKDQVSQFTQIGAEKTASGTTIEWTGLADGYYYISTTTGSFVTVNSITPNVSVLDKNTVPTIDKKQSLTDSGYADTLLHSSIDSTIYYQVEITNGKGTDKELVLEDTMTDGLTLNQTSIAVNKGTTPLVKGTDYTETTEEHKFVITISADYVKEMKEGEVLKVTYSATVNNDAVMDSSTGNKNTAKLDYSAQTSSDTVYVATYDFLLKKTDGTSFLNGAGFKLYDAETGGNQILVSLVDGTYYVDADGDANTEIMVTTAAGANVRGLKPDTYYLEETTTPDGYNTLTERTAVEIVSGATSAKEITVVNQIGSLLPETGGIGTTIFYAAGALLVIGGVVVLVTRKRMENQ